MSDWQFPDFGSMFSMMGNQPANSAQSMWSRMLPGLQQVMPQLGMGMMNAGTSGQQQPNPIQMNFGSLYGMSPLSHMGQDYQSQWQNYRPAMPPVVPGLPPAQPAAPAAPAVQPTTASGGFTGPAGRQFDPLKLGYFPGAYR